MGFSRSARQPGRRDPGDRHLVPARRCRHHQPEPPWAEMLAGIDPRRVSAVQVRSELLSLEGPRARVRPSRERPERRGSRTCWSRRAQPGARHPDALPPLRREMDRRCILPTWGSRWSQPHPRLMRRLYAAVRRAQTRVRDVRVGKRVGPAQRRSRWTGPGATAPTASSGVATDRHFRSSEPGLSSYPYLAGVEPEDAADYYAPGRGRRCGHGDGGRLTSTSLGATCRPTCSGGTSSARWTC
jgi:hypothetical protein